MLKWIQVLVLVAMLVYSLYLSYDFYAAGTRWVGPLGLSLLWTALLARQTEAFVTRESLRRALTVTFWGMLVCAVVAGVMASR